MFNFSWLRSSRGQSSSASSAATPVVSAIAPAAPQKEAATVDLSSLSHVEFLTRLHDEMTRDSQFVERKTTGQRRLTFKEKTSQLNTVKRYIFLLAQHLGENYFHNNDVTFSRKHNSSLHDYLSAIHFNIIKQAEPTSAPVEGCWQTMPVITEADLAQASIIVMRDFLQEKPIFAVILLIELEAAFQFAESYSAVLSAQIERHLIDSDNSTGASDSMTASHVNTRALTDAVVGGIFEDEEDEDEDESRDSDATVSVTIPIPLAVQQSQLVTYDVPPDGNCAYSAVIAGLIYYAFFEKINLDLTLGRNLSAEGGFFDIIEQDKRFVELKNNADIAKQFRCIIALSSDKYALLKETFVPALRNVIADFALAATGDERNHIQAVIEFCRSQWCASVKDVEVALEARRNDTRNPHNKRYEHYFREVNTGCDDGGVIQEGGLVEFVILEMMYGIRIPATNSFYHERDKRYAPMRALRQFCEARLAASALTFDIRQDRNRHHYKLIVNIGPQSEVSNFLRAVNLGWEAQARGQASKKVTPPDNTSTSAAVVSTPLKTHNAFAKRSSPWKEGEQSPQPVTPSSASVASSHDGDNRSESTMNIVVSIPANEFVSAMRQHYSDARFLSTVFDTDIHQPISAWCQLPIAITKATKEAIEKNKETTAVIPYLYSVLLAMRFSTNKQCVEDAKYILRELHQLPVFQEAYKTAMDTVFGLKKLSYIELPSTQLKSEPSLSRLVERFDTQEIDAIAEACRWPFPWSDRYKNGMRESSIAVLEKRHELEKLAADELGKILEKKSDTPNVELTIEEQWLAVKAVADYADTRCSSKGSKETMALSPFHHAIQLLALQRSEDEIQVLDLLRSHIDLSFTKKKGLSFEQRILRAHINTTLLSKAHNAVSRVQKSSAFDNGSRSGSICSKAGVTTPLSRQDASSPGTVFQDIPIDDATTSSGHSLVVPASKSMLDSLHNKEPLTESDAMIVFQLFDTECEDVPGTDIDSEDLRTAQISQHRDKMAQLFSKAFNVMHNLFIDSKRGAHVLKIGMFVSKTTNAPRGFNTMIASLTPRPHAPPYAFALYCYYRCKKTGKALPHEQAFIQQHLVSLEEFKEELNSITVDGKKLGECVAPSAPNFTGDYPLKLIYPELDERVTALETDMNPEKLNFLRKIFTDSKGCFRNMVSPCASAKTITARISSLCKDAQHRQTIVKSKK